MPRRVYTLLQEQDSKYLLGKWIFFKTETIHLCFSAGLVCVGDIQQIDQLHTKQASFVYFDS